MKHIHTFESFLNEGGYYKGIAKSTADKKKSQMKKQANMPDDDPKAYKELPGDTKGKRLLKTSQHTKAYHDMYGKTNEGYMSELDIIRQESKNLQEFIKKAKAEFPQISQMKEADIFLHDLWEMGNKID